MRLDSPLWVTQSHRYQHCISISKRKYSMWIQRIFVWRIILRSTGEYLKHAPVGMFQSGAVPPAPPVPPMPAAPVPAAPAASRPAMMLCLDFWTGYPLREGDILSPKNGGLEDVFPLSIGWFSVISVMMLNKKRLQCFDDLHPRNLKRSPQKSKFLLETIIFRFHVKFRGSRLKLGLGFLGLHQ